MRTSKLLFVSFLMIFIFSCQKEKINPIQNTTKSNSKQNYSSNRQGQIIINPASNVTITLNRQGQFEISDDEFIQSYQELRAALNKINNHFRKDLSSSMMFTINSEGKIQNSTRTDLISNNTYADDLLREVGEMTILNQDLVFDIDINGNVSIISNSSFYERLPNSFKNNFENVCRDKRQQCSITNILRLKLEVNGDLYIAVLKTVNDIPNYNLAASRKSGGCDYDLFKECVGEYWYLPGVNVVTCAIGCAIENLIS